MGRFEDALKKAAKESTETQKKRSGAHLPVDLTDSGRDVEPHIITRLPRQSLYHEQYQTLRINIERKLKHKRHASVLITSSSRGEGKTTTAISVKAPNRYFFHIPEL